MIVSGEGALLFSVDADQDAAGGAERLRPGWYWEGPVGPFASQECAATAADAAIRHARTAQQGPAAPAGTPDANP